MRTKAMWLSAAIMVIAFEFALAGNASAQTTTTVDAGNFEVISVDGNKLVVRNEKGTNEYTVPDDFRFTVDGKQLAVSDLKAGMKGMATVTTTTTIKPVVVTEVREAGGSTRRFTQAELGDRGIQIVRDGQPVRIAELQRGDKLTATIITNGPPVVLTEKEVQATLAESQAELAKMEPAKIEPAKVEPAMNQVATASNVAQPAASAASSPPSAAPPASRPEERSAIGLTWYVAIAALIALALIVFMRRRKRT